MVTSPTDSHSDTDTDIGARDEVVAHFVARADRYDRSSSWCTDDDLAQAVLAAARPTDRDRVLDVACGTGLVSRVFKGVAGSVVGLDITPEMADQAREHVDELVFAPAEAMPFESGSFDVVVCRQGIQFMPLPAAVTEMVRVLAPGGRIVLVNLCAYGAGDAAEYFEILRLRNPVRRHFFLPDELAALLRDAGCDPVELTRHVSVEDVDVWSDNGAIADDRREAIRAVYRTASAEFTQVHAVRQSDGRFVDHMLFIVATGVKPGR